MALVVGFEELGAGDLRVDLRGVQALVAEQFLHEAHVRPALQEMRGAGVAQLMRAERLDQPGPERAAVHYVVQAAPRQASAAVIEEQRFQVSGFRLQGGMRDGG